jgi:hypothetical protein
LLVLGEVEHGLYGVFITDIVEEHGLPSFESRIEQQQNLGALLRQLFLKWLATKANYNG